MYKTSQGERTLRGAERRLFVESLGMIADFLSDNGEYSVDITFFDELQGNQKIAVMLGVARALLRDNVPPPPLTAVNESAVAAVYCNMYDRIVEEVEQVQATDGTDDLDLFGDDMETPTLSWRDLVLDACREATDLEDLPDAENADVAEWEFLIDCLRDMILWDDDWQMEQQLDAAPEQSQRLKEELGIDNDYFVWVPPDPSDDEAAEMIMELRYLTPEGRRL